MFESATVIRYKRADVMQTRREYRGSVLIAEEEEALMAAMGQALRQYGLTVRVTDSGEEALRIAENIQPDVILLGLALRDGNGYDFCREFKKRGHLAHVPVIIVSRNKRMEDRLAGFLAGAQRYVCKPVNIQEVVDQIGFFLAKKETDLLMSRRKSSEICA